MFMANNAQHNVCCIRRPWASDNLPEENNTAVVHNRRTIGQEDKRETTVKQYNITSTVPVKLYTSFLSTDLSACQPIHLSLFPSIGVALYLSMQPSIHHPISVYAIFLVYVSKVLRLPRKIDARSYEVLHLPRKNILANLHIWCSKMQLLSRNLMNMSLVLRLPREMHLCRSSANLPRLPSFLEMPQDLQVLLTFGKVQNPLRLPRKTTFEPSKAVRACGVLNILTLKCASRTFRHLSFQKWSERGVFCTFWFRNVLHATTACAFSTSQLPKVVWTWCVAYILTSKCASRHNGVRFFDISASKSGLNVVCFVHFDFETCSMPQRRALFQHPNFQKWSERGVFRTFWLRNVLRASSRHNGVRFFNISTSKSGGNVVCFVHFDLETCFMPQRRALFQHVNFRKWPEHGVFCAFWLGNVLRATTACSFSALASLLFEPPEPQIIGKPQFFATFLPFRAPASSFFCLFRSLWLFPPLLCLSMLSEVWLLNCLRLLNEIALCRFAYDTDVFSRRAKCWGSSQRRCGDCQLLALGCRWRRCLIRGIYENLGESTRIFENLMQCLLSLGPFISPFAAHQN